MGFSLTLTWTLQFLGMVSDGVAVDRGLHPCVRQNIRVRTPMLGKDNVGAHMDARFLGQCRAIHLSKRIPVQHTRILFTCRKNGNTTGLPEHAELSSEPIVYLPQPRYGKQHASDGHTPHTPVGTEQGFTAVDLPPSAGWCTSTE